MYVLQQFRTCLYFGGATITNSAQQLIAVLGLTPSEYMQGFQLVNNDPAIPVYVGYDNTTTSSKFIKYLAPNGGIWEDLAGAALLRSLYVIAGSGTPAITLAVMQ